MGDCEVIVDRWEEDGIYHVLGHLRSDKDTKFFLYSDKRIEWVKKVVHPDVLFTYFVDQDDNICDGSEMVGYSVGGGVGSNFQKYGLVKLNKKMNDPFSRHEHVVNLLSNQEIKIRELEEQLIQTKADNELLRSKLAHVEAYEEFV